MSGVHRISPSGEAGSIASQVLVEVLVSHAAAQGAHKLGQEVGEEVTKLKVNAIPELRGGALENSSSGSGSTKAAAPLAGPPSSEP